MAVLMGFALAATLAALSASIFLYSQASDETQRFLESLDSETTRHMLVLANQMLTLAEMAAEGAGHDEARPVLLSVSSEADLLAWAAGEWYQATGEERFLQLSRAYKMIASWALRAYNEEPYYQAKVLGAREAVEELAVAVDDVFNSYMRVSLVPPSEAARLASIAARLNG